MRPIRPERILTVRAKATNPWDFARKRLNRQIVSYASLRLHTLGFAVLADPLSPRQVPEMIGTGGVYAGQDYSKARQNRAARCCGL